MRLANERPKLTRMTSSPVIWAVQANSATGAASGPIVIECQLKDPLIALAQAQSSSFAGNLAKYHCNAKFIVTDTPFTA